ncbi:hypothetical protein [Mesorhizobium sp. CN2-181]|uniref:hypothetical protein n=1 Tax=Mesorhizobium yinganensis TaxID=3157707 RepID=UPI0032B796F4
MLATVSDSFAGGKAVECYEPYRTAPVYDTVYENVQVNPASQYVEAIPPIYGTRKRSVLMRPEQVTYEVVPAVVQTRYRTVKIAGGGYSWEWRWINGRKVLCKVKNKARYQQVAETVVVQPEYQRRIVIPAVYSYEIEQVIIQPGGSRVVNMPATYQTVARQVLVSEGTTGWKRVKIRRHCG